MKSPGEVSLQGWASSTAAAIQIAVSKSQDGLNGVWHL